MVVGTADKVRFGLGAQIALRVLIASYFLAVALKLIPGVDYGALFAAFLSPLAADALAAGAVFLLTFAIMTGLATRLCALLLGLLTLCAGFVGLTMGASLDTIATFWGDLALVGGLMLLYGDTPFDRRLQRRLIRRANGPRRVDPAMAQALNARPETRPLPSDAELRTIFQSPDRARAIAKLPKPEAPVERLADHRKTTGPDATFLRARTAPIVLGPPRGHPDENIFADDPEVPAIQRPITLPRRVIAAE